MITAPRSDLRFSHSTLFMGCDGFFPPARAAATTFLDLGGLFSVTLAMTHDGRLACAPASEPHRQASSPLLRRQNGDRSRRAPRVGLATNERGPRHSTRPPGADEARDYLMCLLTSLVISNIETLPLPPNTALSLSSALIMRRSFAS